MKWKGNKANEPTEDHKLYYTGKNNVRIGVYIVVDRDLKEKIVEVKRLGDGLVGFKLVLGDDGWLVESVKREFWKEMDG